MHNRVVALFAGVAVLGCGGAKGQTHTGGEGARAGESPDAAVKSAWGGGAPDSAMSGDWDTYPDARIPEAEAPIRFELKNMGKTELTFAIDKGWQPTLFGQQVIPPPEPGTPPKRKPKKPPAPQVKPVVFFEMFCTASCDLTAEEMCPSCKPDIADDDYKALKQHEREETKRVVVAPGESTLVPWDGQLFVYERAPREARRAGKNPDCLCYRKTDPEPGTYRILARGLRPAEKVGQATRVVMAHTEVTFPLAEVPATITVVFE